MTIAAWAQGWASIARTRMGRAGRRVSARALLTGSDLLGWSGPLPDRIIHAPRDPRTPEAETGEALHSGVYALDGGMVKVPEGITPWRANAPSECWKESLNGFDWLRHISTLGPDLAGEHARWLVNTWMHECGTWDALAWRPHVTARRLMTWMALGRMILDGSDLIWRSAFLRSITRQSHHLHQTAQWTPDDERRLTAAIGLALTGLCLPHGEKRLERGMALTLDALERQILPDGGHISRNPSVLAGILRDLMVLETALEQRKASRPEPLQHALDRMAPMVRFFRHGDGRLASFHGGMRLTPPEVDAVLALDDTAGQPLKRAPQSGYQRIARGETVAVMDTGVPPSGDLAIDATAGCLSFELSIGVDRVIVNCGASRAHGATWRRALRATAAQSTVTVGDMSSCTFLTVDTPRPMGDGRVISGPRTVPAERADYEEGSLIEASHDGYERTLGIMHRRRLYIDAAGTDIRGEDTLAKMRDLGGPARKTGLAAVARFHLHPDVTPQLAGNGDSVQLTLPSGKIWHFRATGGSVALEESPYLDDEDRLRRSRQIVVHTTLDSHTTVVKWALQAVAAGSDGHRNAAPMAARPENPAEDTADTASDDADAADRHPDLVD